MVDDNARPVFQLEVADDDVDVDGDGGAYLLQQPQPLQDHALDVVGVQRVTRLPRQVHGLDAAARSRAAREAQLSHVSRLFSDLHSNETCGAR